MYGRIRWGLVLPPRSCSAAFGLGRPSPSLLRTRPWRPVPRRAAWTTRGCEHWRARPLCYRPGRVGVQWSTTRERVCIHCEEPPLVRRSVRPRHPPLVVTTSAARTRVWTTPRIPRRVVPRANVHGKRHAARELHRGAMADAAAAHARQRSRGGMLAPWGGGVRQIRTRRAPTILRVRRQPNMLMRARLNPLLGLVTYRDRHVDMGLPS